MRIAPGSANQVSKASVHATKIAPGPARNVCSIVNPYTRRTAPSLPGSAGTSSPSIKLLTGRALRASITDLDVRAHPSRRTGHRSLEPREYAAQHSNVPVKEIAVTRHWLNRLRLIAVGAIVLAGTGMSALQAGAATAACGTLGIATINAALGIDAAHVTSVHPETNPKALICSYYGNSGRAANEVTINYVPATAASFAAVKASNAPSHQLRTITGIKSFAYSYVIGTERYLYVLDGTDQVQMFTIAPLAKLEVLARKMPLIS